VWAFGSAILARQQRGYWFVPTETILPLKVKLYRKLRVRWERGLVQVGGQLILNKREYQYKRLLEMLNCLEKHCPLGPFYLLYWEKG